MISVVIPVYNTGPLLRRSVESVLRQTLDDFEVVIVDDGSSLETLRLCDTLGEEDSRVRVIHTRNGGVSKARNNGLKAARGDIVCFLDSDDAMHPEMLETLAKAIEKGTDIAMCDSVFVDVDGTRRLETIPDYRESAIFDAHDMTPEALARMAGAVWRCAYRKSLLDKNDIRFSPDLKLSEDRLFNIIAMGRARKIAYVKRPLYDRIVRPGSAVFSYRPDFLDQVANYWEAAKTATLSLWGEPYFKAVEKYQIVNSIHNAIVNYAMPGNGLTFQRRYDAMKALCSNPAVICTLADAKAMDLRSLAVRLRIYRLLIAIGEGIYKIKQKRRQEDKNENQ